MSTDRTLPPGAHMIPPEARMVFSGEVFDVFQWPQRLYDGSVATFEMLRRADTVITIGLDDHDRIVTIDEEQPGGVVRHGGVSAGGVEPTDPSVLAAAQREMAEETGFRFRTWRLLEVRQPESKIEWFVHVFGACDVESVGDQHLDAGEKIEVRPVPFTDYVRGTRYNQQLLSTFTDAGAFRKFIRCA